MKFCVVSSYPDLNPHTNFCILFRNILLSTKGKKYMYLFVYYMYTKIEREKTNCGHSICTCIQTHAHAHIFHLVCETQNSWYQLKVEKRRRHVSTNLMYSNIMFIFSILSWCNLVSMSRRKKTKWKNIRPSILMGLYSCVSA